ncbi:hypothetical protein GCK32_004774 [Trichostrongylus colubriformis]|uniref:Uncharacterized protein n=1 Tax=Trichostrongylus colubriformis TaxID=6319 RepID=A0AAN8G2D4_TRICO
MTPYADRTSRVHCKFQQVVCCWQSKAMGSGLSAIAKLGPTSYEEEANMSLSPTYEDHNHHDDDNGQGRKHDDHDGKDHKPHSSARVQTSKTFYNIEDIENSDMDTMADVTDKESSHLIASTKTGRKIALVRQAETMNELPLRSKGLRVYDVDPPITRLAEHAASILGKALASETDIKWHTVITAPELASVQTGAAIAFSLAGDKTYVSIDEYLCEFTHRKMNFMTPMELMKMDVAAKVTEAIGSKESTDDSLGRVVGGIDAVQRKIAGNLIIVVGPTAFDAILQQLLGCDRKKMKSRKSIPQLACIILERGPKSWTLSKKQILPLSNNNYASTVFDPLYYTENKH